MSEVHEEIQKIEKELEALDTDINTAQQKTVAAKQQSLTSSSTKSMGYNDVVKYIGAVILIFLFLLIFKPAFILTIKNVNGQNIIVVNKGKFFLYWILLSLVICGIIFAVKKFKK